MSRTLYDKLVDAHKVCDLPDGDMLVYVDFHIMNEYTSPQAFSGLDHKGLKVWRPQAHLSVVDHVNATRQRDPHDAASKLLIDNLEANCRKHGIAFYGLGDPRQGIEHVVVPEQGLVAPGMLIVCGDSHTTTYGAFGALGFGIGTSEVEHVLATQTLRYKRLRTMRVNVEGALAPGVTAKDIIMQVVQVVGAGGANGFAVEFTGNTIFAQSMAGRMTICNMAVELGARAALIAADQTALTPPRPGCATTQKPGPRTRAPPMTRPMTSTPPQSHRWSVGGQARINRLPSTAPCPTPAPPPHPRRNRPSHARWTTWGWNPASRSPTSASTAPLSGHAPTAVSRIFAPRRL